jgi:uncharacterized integral membrane protein (TIGR00698 family)
MLRGAAIVLPLTLLAWFLAPLPGIQVLGPLGIALLLAALTRAVFGLPKAAEPGVRFFARPLLRAAIVIMGVRLDFTRLAQAGPRVLLVDVLVVFLGASFVAWLGGRLKVRRPLALLLGVGSSVCGASAIAAAGPLVRAEEDDVAVSIGLVSLLGTIGVVSYPALGRLLHLPDGAYALLCGATLHEVPQVLAAAFARGQEAGDFGTLVKLTRVALLAPLALGLAALEARRGGDAVSWRKLPVPWFVVGFVLVGVLRSLGAIPAALLVPLEQLSRVLLVAAMAAVGLGVHAAAVRRLGWTPIALAVLGWLFVIATAGIAAVALGLLG